MNASKLLRFLLSRGLCLGIVDSSAGGDVSDDQADSDDGQDDTTDGGEVDADSEDDADTEGSDDEGTDAGDDGDDASGDGDLVVTIGSQEPEEEDPARAPEWLRELRKSNREKDRRIRELEAKVSTAAPAPAAIVVGEKPTLESCSWDAPTLEKELDAWHERKRQAAEQERTRSETEGKQREAWQKTQDAYGAAKTKLKVTDFADAEGTVQDALSPTQQGVLIHGLEPKQAALLVYALGKNPTKLKELAAVTDPVKFAIAAARLESQMKVTPKKAAPAPERTVRSSVPGAAAVDSQIERLRREARETGDYSKVTDYRRQQQDKQKKRA